MKHFDNYNSVSLVSFGIDVFYSFLNHSEKGSVGFLRCQRDSWLQKKMKDPWVEEVELASQMARVGPGSAVCDLESVT